MTTAPGGDTAFRKYEHAGAYHHALMAHDAFYVAKIAKAVSLVREGNVVLDVGCGDGVFIKRARDRAGVIVGLDPSVDGVRLARAMSGVATVLTGSAYDLPVRTASVDLVIMLDVVNYLSHCEDGIREAARVLRPGGRLVVMSPCEVSLDAERAAIPHSWQARAWSVDQITGFVSTHLRVTEITFIEKAVPVAVLGFAARAAQAIGIDGAARLAAGLVRRQRLPATGRDQGGAGGSANIVLNTLSLPPSLIKTHEKLEFVVVAVRDDADR